MKASAVAVVIAVLMAPAQAQEQRPLIQPNTVYVGADGKFEAPPDTVLVQFNISAQEESSQAAYDRGARAAEQVRKLLRDNGIDPKQAQVGFFTLEPVYDYRTAKRRLVGYRANTSVTLKLKDFSKVGPIVQKLSALDITENQTLSYILEDMEAAKVKAVEDAYQRARAMADAIAKAGGRVIGSLSYASVDVHEPVPIMADMAMRTMAAEAARTPPPTAEFSAQKITVNANVKALFTLELK